ncbi:YbjN domain-containing protein [Treponema sp. TIM-1]|uniref:YbjN domain-containing protein n=1 Tax=Treponema sp. TIM-1 TaxID=2898417 RepID=UPI00398095C4
MALNKIEQYLIDLMVSYREIGKNMWLLDDAEHGLEAAVIVYDDPLVVFQITVMEAPQERRLELFTKLLELNAQDILHGAYALEENKVILIDTLEYAGMDFTEFRATLDAFGLALTQHYPILSPFRA